MYTKSMRIKDGELYLGSYSLVKLANQYHTPLFVYDELGVMDKISLFKKYFVSSQFKCEITYASKAFLAPYLCKLLLKNDVGIDAVSVGDLHLINKSGFPSNKVLLHGNNKSDHELNAALDMKIQYVVVDSYTELLKLDKLAQARNQVVNTLFRINPGIHADTHAYIETSLLSSKFGESLYDEEVIDIIANIYRNSKYLKFEGFHAHIGSQVSNPQSFVALAKTMINFANNFKQKYNMPINVLNLGGGFAIKYQRGETGIDLPQLLTVLVQAVEDELKMNDLKIKKLMIEPGRSIIGDSGFTLYKVGLLKKTFGGKKYVFIDGGMVDNIRPALYQAKYTVDVANRINKGTEKESLLASSNLCDVVGKCCESGDIVAEGVNIGEVYKGDTLIVYSTGAYCYSMSMNYNGLLRGAVIFVNGDKITEVIKRQTLDDLVTNHNFEV